MADSVTKIQGVVVAGLVIAQVVTLVMQRSRGRETYQALLNLAKSSKQADDQLERHFSKLHRLEFGLKTSGENLAGLHDQLWTEVKRIDNNTLRDLKRVEALESELAELRELIGLGKEGKAV